MVYASQTEMLERVLSLICKCSLLNPIHLSQRAAAVPSPYLVAPSAGPLTDVPCVGLLPPKPPQCDVFPDT